MIITNEAFSVRTIKNMSERNQIDFQPIEQRGYIWKPSDVSLYVHSLLIGLLAFHQPCLAAKAEDGSYKVIDGQQRMTSLTRFVGNEFKLTGLSDEDTVDYCGKKYVINGKSFKELPVEFQDKILDFQFNVAVMHGATQEQTALMFYRFNLGKQVKKIDLARSKNLKAAEVIAKFRTHQMFKAMFDKEELDSLKQDATIIKIWMLLFGKDKNLYRYAEILNNLEITEDEVAEIQVVLDKLYDAYDNMVLFEKPSRISGYFRESYMLTYVTFVNKFEDGLTLGKWIKEFFGKIPESYKSYGLSQRLPDITSKTDIVAKSIAEFLEED